MRLAMIAVTLLLWGCSEQPASSSYKDATCVEKSTGRTVDARAFKPLEGRPVRWFEWTDENGIDREINARNSDEWSCRLRGK